jgi:hypothetical protein
MPLTVEYSRVLGGTHAGTRGLCIKDEVLNDVWSQPCPAVCATTGFTYSGAGYLMQGYFTVLQGPLRPAEYRLRECKEARAGALL